MDPNHVIKALAVMYLEEHEGRIRVSKSFLVDAYRKANKITVQIIQPYKPFSTQETPNITIFLED